MLIDSIAYDAGKYARCRPVFHSSAIFTYYFPIGYLTLFLVQRR